ncbi:MAG: hypothetical protein M3018_04010, partial [Actinomycetota bacterium]|nr:hypothetical protein [Actinomycetota bacterium]
MDSWIGLILPYLVFSLPLSTDILWLSCARSRGTSRRALSNEATPMYAFRKVILPLAIPGVFIAGILAFIAAWNDFLFANVLTATNASRTAPVAVPYFTGASQWPTAGRRDRSAVDLPQPDGPTR